jgi:O-antigen/teichoic acid export membrane protein
MLYLDVIAVLIGPNYRAAVGIVPILLIAYLFLGIFYNFSIWFKLADKTTVGGYMALGGAAITVVLNVLLIPHIGYYGPAWAALACYAFMIVVCYWTGQRYYPIEYPIGRMALYLLMALGAYAFGQLNGRWFSNSLVWKLAANTLVFLLFSGMVLWVERGAVAGLLRRFRRLPQA